MGRKQILPRGLQNLAPRDLQMSRDIFGRGKTLQSSGFCQDFRIVFRWSIGFPGIGQWLKQGIGLGFTAEGHL